VTRGREDEARTTHETYSSSCDSLEAQYRSGQLEYLADKHYVWFISVLERNSLGLLIVRDFSDASAYTRDSALSMCHRK
jgi:hypothetical protein